MTGKDELRHYLQVARDALVWKLDGLGEYDVRRPLTPTGTNLLGLVKHYATVEFGYFTDTCGRPHHEPTPWLADESRTGVVALYRRAWPHSDVTIAALPLDASGRVAWCPGDRGAVTLQQIMVHTIAETHRHAGHADIVRELIDGTAGLRADNDNLAPGDGQWWANYRARLEAVARQCR